MATPARDGGTAGPDDFPQLFKALIAATEARATDTESSYVPFVPYPYGSQPPSAATQGTAASAGRMLGVDRSNLSKSCVPESLRGATYGGSDKPRCQLSSRFDQSVEIRTDETLKSLKEMFLEQERERRKEMAQKEGELLRQLQREHIERARRDFKAKDLDLLSRRQRLREEQEAKERLIQQRPFEQDGVVFRGSAASRRSQREVIDDWGPAEESYHSYR